LETFTKKIPEDIVFKKIICYKDVVWKIKGGVG